MCIIFTYYSLFHIIPHALTFFSLTMPFLALDPWNNWTCLKNFISHTKYYLFPCGSKLVVLQNLPQNIMYAK